jgi:hypothetical protein
MQVIRMFTRRRFLQHSLGACALIATSRGRNALAGEGTVRTVAPFGEAVEIAGTARERGRQYGRQVSDLTHEFLDREIYTAFVGKPALKEDMLRYADACWRVIRAECPIIADELEGMAEGTGLRLEEHVLVTLHEELYHRGVLPPVPHCTAVAVGPPETRNGGCYVGQTWDWMPTVAGMSTMLHWRRKEGPSLLAYAFPGLWVGAGLNANGLALCWTSADLGQKGQTVRVGLPSYVFLSHLLYQENLEAVRESASKNKHAGWFTFVIGDGQGRLLNVEGSPAGLELEESTGRLIRVGYGTRQMSRTPSDQPVKMHARCQTMDRLIKESSGQVGLAMMQRSFGDPSRGICVGKGTIDMMVFDTVQRTAHVSRGAEYGVAWKDYRFISRTSG